MQKIVDDLDTVLRKRSDGVRKRGFFLLLVGGVVMGMIVAAVVWLLPAFEIELNPVGLAVVAIPGSIGLVGLLELISGVPFRDWSAKWDGMKGWQRGVLGLLIVAVALGMIIVVATFLLD